MKITEEIKDELFIEFCDIEANNEIGLSKDAFKEAINKALSLCGVVKSLKDKETPHFYDWLKENKTDFAMDKLLFKGDWYFIGDLYYKYKKEFNIPF